MVISSIKIRKIEEDKNIFKGVASIVLDDMFAINNIKIYQGKNEMYLSMPKQKEEVAHPLNQRTRDVFERLIIPAYSEMILHDWHQISLSLREEYQNIDFHKLSYELYNIEHAIILVPEKYEFVEI